MSHRWRWKTQRVNNTKNRPYSDFSISTVRCGMIGWRDGKMSLLMELVVLAGGVSINVSRRRRWSLRSHVALNQLVDSVEPRGLPQMRGINQSRPRTAQASKLLLVSPERSS
jgi:hypothetical protein